MSARIALLGLALLAASWQDGEKRAEYDKRSRALASVRADSLAKLGQWCAENGLPGTARTLFAQALQAVPDHAAAKEGQAKASGADGEQPKFEETRRRLLTSLANELAALGGWCRQNGLDAEARRHLEEAVSIDPDHRAARKALGQVKVGDEWMAEAEAAAARKELEEQKRRLANVTYWSTTVSYSGEIPKEWYEKTDFKGRMIHAAKILWWATRGQMGLKEVKIGDKGAEPGEFHMDSLDKVMNARGAYGSGVNPVVVGGLFGGGTVIHELMHIKLGVGDEYGCPDCVMTQPKDGWGTPNFCDGSNHVPKSRETNCWSLLMQQYPRLRWPVKTKEPLGTYLQPPKEWGPMPECKVVINDR
jgi:hypothetical protein